MKMYAVRRVVTDQHLARGRCATLAEELDVFDAHNKVGCMAAGMSEGEYAALREHVAEQLSLATGKQNDWNE